MRFRWDLREVAANVAVAALVVAFLAAMFYGYSL